ncbi:MAG: hypothetical protein KF799_00185 [Bdellovibrionales bacterium]|nr:hypothetical protein [Bdellovibrionales bacterium]
MLLQELSSEHENAFLIAMADYQGGDAKVFACFGNKSWDKKQFAVHLKETQKRRMDWRPKQGKVSETSYVLIDENGRLCGNGLMRFPLNPEMEWNGGNLLFSVPPSLRGQGFGALTLNRMLFEAVRAGLARVLVSCPSSDKAMRCCIEKNRGQLAGEQDGVVQYWIRFR